MVSTLKVTATPLWEQYKNLLKRASVIFTSRELNIFIDVHAPQTGIT